MKLVSKNGKAQQAFTLVDVMVGMGVLGIVLLSLFASFTFGFGIVRLSREEVQATQILHEKMEVIRLYNWSQVNTNNFIPEKFHESLGNTTFTGEIVITNVPFIETYSTNMRKVTVTVNWMNNRSLRSRSISTFVAKNGMQDYIVSVQE